MSSRSSSPFSLSASNFPSVGSRMEQEDPGRPGRVGSLQTAAQPEDTPRTEARASSGLATARSCPPPAAREPEGTATNGAGEASSSRPPRTSFQSTQPDTPDRTAQATMIRAPGPPPLHVPPETNSSAAPAPPSRAPSTPPWGAPSDTNPPSTASSAPDELTQLRSFADAAAHVSLRPAPPAPSSSAAADTAPPSPSPAAAHPSPAQATHQVTGRPSTSSTQSQNAPSTPSHAPSASIPPTPFYPPTPSHPDYCIGGPPSSTPPSSSFVSSAESRVKPWGPKDYGPKDYGYGMAGGLAAAGSTSSELHAAPSSIPEVEDSLEQDDEPHPKGKPHKGTSFGQHVNALTRKSMVYQRRKACTNACLLVGPIFFPILMFALQAATNALFLGQDQFSCGCQCVDCCRDVKLDDGSTQRQCSPVDFGTCDDQGGTCQKIDEQKCGIRYSSPVQAIWCPIKRPSTWPPVLDMPRPRYFPPPYGPFQAMPMLYTSDPSSLPFPEETIPEITYGSGASTGGTGRRMLGVTPDLTLGVGPDAHAKVQGVATPGSTPIMRGRGLEEDNFLMLGNKTERTVDTEGPVSVKNHESEEKEEAAKEVEPDAQPQDGYLFRQNWQWEVEDGINGEPLDNAQLVANMMLNLPYATPTLTNVYQVQQVLNNLVVEGEDGSLMFNGHLLSKLGFKFGSAHDKPFQYYLDTAFINEGLNSETDVILVLMPNKTCEDRGMEYDIFQKEGEINNKTGEPELYWVTRTYDPVTFLVKFYSYDIEGLEAFLEQQGFSAEEQVKGTMLESIKVGCVDAPSKRLSSRGALDDTLFCGWGQNGPVGEAECFKKYNQSYYGPIESYAAGFNFLPEISLSSFTAIIQHNCTLRLADNAPTDGFCRNPALLNLAVQGWDAAFLGRPERIDRDSLLQNGTAVFEEYQDFLQSEEAQSEFGDNEDFNTTRDFFLNENNNFASFLNNQTAQNATRDFFTNQTVLQQLGNSTAFQNFTQSVLGLDRGDPDQQQTSLFRRSNELLGLMSFPKLEDSLTIDFSSLIGPLFYCWVVQLAMPSMLQQLVYEKEKRLRVIMKMHGLPDSAYWLVSYVWNFLIYAAGILLFVIIGSAVGLEYFIRNSYGVQAVFYILFGQVQLAFTFFLSSLFSSSHTAVVAGYVYVLASGILGFMLFQPLMADDLWWLWLIELIPAFALYRGLFEFGAYSFKGAYSNTFGMRFSDLDDEKNGMVTVWIIMAVEWAIFMVLAWYTEQVIPTGNGTPRHPLFFISWIWRRKGKGNPWDEEPPSLAAGGAGRESSTDSSTTTAQPDSVSVMMQRDFNTQYEDVKAEVARVEGMRSWPSERMPLITSIHLNKVFPALGGAPQKLAVKDMTIAIERGECMGLLGPNGAGKTTSINMLTGLIKPSGGDAVIAGYSIRKDMPKIHRLMGVCPQHDLTWEALTGREHLMFYGRLKGLNGKELEKAVEESLHSVALHGLVANKLAGEYSGGMRRRLSVGMAFMGRPRVVYLDEPSTGLDPMSRKQLWSVVKAHKDNCAIILTTHSMQEAELLCDRIGIFVEGQLVCLDTPTQITSRFAGFLVLTITVPQEQEPQARQLAESLTPAARLSYALGGTLKYELPKDQVTLTSVFKAVHDAKSAGLRMEDWAVTSATLEEVFIKLARVADDSHLV